MSRTQTQGDQSVIDVALPRLRLPTRSQLATIIPAIDQNFNSPLRIFASNPSDALLNIAPQQVQRADGVGQSVPPVSSTIPTVPASTINFQTGATTGASFVGLTFPTTTVGQFRRLGLTLLASGQINAIWSAQAASVGALANPGTLFVRNGIPIGWIDLEATAATAFKTAGSATSIIENAVGGTSRINLFGSGGSGGAGAGDANSFLEDLKARLRDSFWGWVTPNIFSQQEQALIDVSSTGTYDIAGAEYDLPAVGNRFVSTNLLGSAFRSSDAETAGAELHVLWNNLDTAAVYELSLNGGTTWQPLTMNRIGESKKYVGEVQFNPSTSVIHEFAIANEDGTEAFNATTRQFLAMPIVVGAGVKQKVISGNVYLNKTGLPLGDLFIRLVRDSAGSPSLLAADILAESSPISIGSMAAGNVTIPFSVVARLPAGTYHLMLVPSDQYRSSFVAGTTEIRWRTDSSAPVYAAGDLRAYNGTAWSAITGEDACFQLTGFAYDLRIRITSSQANVSLNGMGVFFAEQGAYKKDTPLPEYQRFVVNGSNDQTSFVITQFVPDPDTLRVFEGFAGRSLLFGKDFTINGQTITFASGTFLFPGDTAPVLFDQRMGFGQGNDRAMNILAANFLGSLDPAFDLSQAGRGILLRRPDGVLREIRLDNDDNIVIETAP